MFSFRGWSGNVGVCLVY